MTLRYQNQYYEVGSTVGKSYVWIHRTLGNAGLGVYRLVRWRDIQKLLRP